MSRNLLCKPDSHPSPSHRSHQDSLNCLRERGKASEEVARALVAARVHIQILLVVRLSIPPLACRQNLSADTSLPPLLVDLLGDLLCDLLLLVIVVENRAAVLCADVRALAVFGGGVVHLVEELEQRAVFDLGGVVHDLQGFGVYSESARYGPDMRALCAGCSRINSRAHDARRKEHGTLAVVVLLTSCPPAAHSAISRVVCVATNVADARIIQPLLAKLASIHVLDAPEAPCGDGRSLGALGHVHRLCGSGGHACEWAEELCEKGHREVEEKGE